MAAPAATARTTPVGIKLEDGFSTKITFSRDPDVSFWEISVTPPGWEGGDPIDTTTMFNSVFRTKAARNLKEQTEASATVAYDPQVKTQIQELLNAEGTVTVHYPDGSSEAFYGYLKTFEHQENSEGEFPQADITIVPTQWDPANRVEAGPTVVSVSGT